ncbi:hypothetical protein [Fimbriiglobus ruber]|uniref:Uncharacterized protein n=1 Tax=Fimbriiglobus ruber TaxID=1908690 RepID=A0A225D6T9_9BACT|nr:hypothetical protein [Fimbriiglobus ruber]OWK37301.1 hypothetical protein FRUB_06421 [Fimbriiglobus ruber]
MTPSDRRLWLDLQTARYLDALERFDFDRQDELWALAAADPELEAAFHSLHVGLEEADAEATADALAAAVEKHLPSAEIVRPAAGPVTVSMVAEELFRHTPDRLSADAHALNDRLRQSADELPAELGLPTLTAWAEARFGPAPAEYWQAFRQAAIKTRMRARADEEFQIAARNTRRKPEGG